MAERNPSTTTPEDEAVLRELAAKQILGDARGARDRRQTIRFAEPSVEPIRIPQRLTETPPATPAPAAPAAEARQTVTVRPEPPAPVEKRSGAEQVAVTSEIRRLVAGIQAEKEAELAEKRAKAADPRTVFRNRPWLTGDMPSAPASESPAAEPQTRPAPKRPMRVPAAEADPSESLAESILARRMAAEDALGEPSEAEDLPQSPKASQPSQPDLAADVDEDALEPEPTEDPAPRTSGGLTTFLIVLSAMAMAAMIAYLFFMN